MSLAPKPACEVCPAARCSRTPGTCQGEPRAPGVRGGCVRERCFWRTPRSATLETCLWGSGRFDLCPPFKGHLSPFTCRNRGPFPHNNQPLFTPFGVLGTWRQRRWAGRHIKDRRCQSRELLISYSVSKTHQSGGRGAGRETYLKVPSLSVFLFSLVDYLCSLAPTHCFVLTN